MRGRSEAVKMKIKIERRGKQIKKTKQRKQSEREEIIINFI